MRNERKYGKECSKISAKGQESTVTMKKECGVRESEKVRVKRAECRRRRQGKERIGDLTKDEGRPKDQRRTNEGGGQDWIGE